MNRRRFLGGTALLAALPALAAPKRFDRGVLWRLSRKDAPPSHLYGTLHLADARLQSFPAPVEQAFGASRALMLEFVPDPYAQERFTEAALFLDSQTLEQKIGAADFERVLERLRPIGLPREFVARMKPWGVLINLRGAGALEGLPLEARLAELARQRRMPTSQMEGVEEQIFTFDEMPRESQVALLRHSLAHADELAELSARTLDAYLARDLERIWRLREAHIARHPQVATHQAVMTRRILYDRSVVMAFRMQRELRRGGAFVALGALHLHGEKGVLALLEEDGYRAVRVY